MNVRRYCTGHAGPSLAMVALLLVSVVFLLVVIIEKGPSLKASHAAVTAEAPKEKKVVHHKTYKIVKHNPTRVLTKDRCLNPYNEHGLLYAPVEEELTAWVPFYSGLLKKPYSSLTDSKGRSSDQLKRFSRVFTDSPPPQEMLEQAPHPWFANMLETVSLSQHELISTSDREKLAKLNEEFSWLKDRRVLVISDTVDRKILADICEMLGEHMEHDPDVAEYAVMSCHLPLWNFTISNWYLTTISASRPSWWWIPKVKVVPFQSRVAEYFKNHKDSIGTRCKPDLVIMQSSLMDHEFFARARQEYYKTTTLEYMRPLNWREIIYYMQRLRTHIGTVRELFGRDTPIVWRSTTLERRTGTNAAVRNLDRAARFTCTEMDVEVMEFGGIAGVYFDQYRDTVNLKRGPLTVLYANMLMYYLFRTQGGVEVKGEVSRPRTTLSLGAAWRLCHDVYMSDS